MDVISRNKAKEEEEIFLPSGYNFLQTLFSPSVESIRYLVVNIIPSFHLIVQSQQ